MPYVPTAPSKPDLTPASDSGSSNTDNLTSDTTPTFTGTAEANSTVELFADGDGASIGSTTTDSAGSWSYTVPVTAALSDGSSAITATASTGSGSSSATLQTPPIAPASPGRTTQEWRNSFAFAALKEDGSVITWGHSAFGGDSSAVAGDLQGGVSQLFSTEFAFAAVKEDGSVITWGRSGSGGDSSAVAGDLQGGVSQLFSTGSAFAAVKKDGSVITWGDGSRGGDSRAVAGDLQGGVSQLFSTYGAFAALKEDGSVITWGRSGYGGDSSSVAGDLQGGVSQLFSTYGAFAAVKEDGSVITWGPSGYGGDSSSVAGDLQGGVSQLFSTYGAFAAVKEDGSVITWGDSDAGGDSSAVAGDLQGGVSQLFSTDFAFAAVKEDGSVITWGDSDAGGDSSAVAGDLQGGVSQLFSTYFAFAAVKEDGSVITWGHSGRGGDSSAVAGDLQGGVSQLFSTYLAFAAVKEDGSVITWGDSGKGGDSSAVAGDLQGGVSQLFSTDSAFAAVKEDGSVITWGHSAFGGDSSSVADQLQSGVVSFADPFQDDRLVFGGSGSGLTSDPSPALTLTIDTTAPAFTSAGSAAAIDENSGTNQVIYTASTSDTSPVTYSLKSGNDDAASFSIDSSSGEVTLNTDPDYETQSSYVFTVIATDAAGNSTEQTVTLAVNDLDDPATGTLSIDGVAEQGSTLTAALNDLVDPDGSIQSTTYQWQSSSDNGATLTDLAEATGSQFAIPNDQSLVGKDVRVVAITTDAAGGSTSFSSAAQTIANVDDPATGTLSIDGVAEQGSTLTAALNDLVDPDGSIQSTTYQWQSSSDNGATLTDLAEATGSQFAIPNDQSLVGKDVRVVAITTDAAGGSTSFSSAAQTIANVDDPATGTLSIDGVAEQGSTLTAALNDLVDPDGSIQSTTYQWQSSSDNGATLTDLAEATGSQFAIPNDQSLVGKDVRVVAITTDAAGGSTSFSSAAQTIANVDDPATGTLSIDGVAEQGSTLTAALNDLVDPDGSIQSTTYQWQSSSDNGATLTDLAEATGSQFAIPNDQSLVGKDVRVVAITTDAAGGSTSFSSAAQTIANVDDPATGTLSIDGVAEQGSTLTAALNDLVDPDGSIQSTTYQWQSSSDNGATLTDLAEATGSQFAIPNDQSLVGKDVRVVAITTDAAGGSTSFSSAAQTIANVDDPATGTLSIDGVAEQGSTLTAALNDLVDPDGSIQSTTYQWQSSSDNGATLTDLAEATGSQFAIPNDQSLVGKDVRVVAITTDAAGGSTSFSSAAQTIAIDTTPPAAPSAPDLTPASDSGSSNTDNLTSDTTPTFTGTAEANSTVELFADGDGASIGSTTTDSAGSWSYTVPVAVTAIGAYDGSSAITAIATDAAGNASPSSPALTLTIDTTAPAFISAGSAAAIDENSGTNQVIYTASTSDTSPVTNSLKSGNDDAASFSIDSSSSEVTLNTDPDYETQSSYAFTVIATDAAGNSTEQPVTLAVNDLDEDPTNLLVSASSFDENITADSVVATLSSTDPDAGETFTYSLVSGTGDTDNSAFSVDGDQLKITASPDHETQESYSVRLRTTDSGGLSFEKAFTLNVNDLSEYLDSDFDGFVDGASNYKLFDSGTAIDLTNKKGNKYSDASSKSWDAIKAIKTDSGFQVLLDGAARIENKFLAWTTNDSGVITKSSGWKTGDQMMELGYEETFDMDINGDSITGLPPVSDDDSDGFVDGSSNYKLFDSGIAIDLTNKKGTKYSDASTKSWDAIKAIKTDSGFQVLLDGAASKENKFLAWTTNDSGVITKSSGWKTGDQMMELGYEETFDMDINGDSITGLPPVSDDDSDGFVDGSSNYKLFDSGTAIDLTNKKGNKYSDASSKSWDAIKAIKTDSGFQVLLDGAASKENKFFAWTTNDSGVITKSSGWKTGDQMMELGYEETFDMDINGDSITGLPPVSDDDSDGFVDGSSNYKLFDSGTAIDLTNKKGTKYSDASTTSWDAIKAIKTDSGFQVLLDGAASKENKFLAWTTNDSGVITKSSGWKTGDQMMELGYEETFDIDINGDEVTGLPFVDSDFDGFVDGSSNYKLFHSGTAIDLTNKKGTKYSDASTKSWDAIKAIKTDSGFLVLLDGAASIENQFYVWTVDSSGVITKGSGWKTGEQMMKLGYEDTFEFNMNGNPDIGI